MSDLIKLLPDHVANQIAAGEVVQRPASVVKELLENALDAGAGTIELIVRDSGKALIQVVDNGCGMSETDARNSFLRHATSKISSADDLYKLKTMGFRGEALASICAISHVVLRTRRIDDELGTEIVNEGTEIKSQDLVACQSGTSVSVKNLFYNVPARRNFLSRDLTEYRHILEEFMRVALANEAVAMKFTHNDEEVYDLPVQQRRQRIVQVFGNSFNERLVPIEEGTELVGISGYVTKPEYARTVRDNQYFFVNNRFFRDRYLGHAIHAAFEGLIQVNKNPGYFIFFDIDPSFIDVNVHPTKTEIKFQDSKTIYAFLRSTIRQSLGKFNISPTLDFERETSFDHIKLDLTKPVKVPGIKLDPAFNPFAKQTGTVDSKSQTDYSPDDELLLEREHVTIASSLNDELNAESKKPVQIHLKYILKQMRDGFVLVDQYRAHVRILFDQICNSSIPHATQQLAIPEKLEHEKTDMIWSEVIPALNESGFDLLQVNDSIEIRGIPVQAGKVNPIVLLNEIVDDYRDSLNLADLDISSAVALASARAMALRGGRLMSPEEMQDLLERLFSCETPHMTPDGKKVIEHITHDEIYQRFS